MSNQLSKQAFVIENMDPLKLIFEQLFNPIVITTSQLELPGPQIVYVNSAFCKQTGYTLEELIGKTPRIFQGEKTDRAVLDRLKQKLLAGEFFQESTVNYRKDGSEYWVEWNISALYDEEGKNTHYFCVQHDITAFKELENARKLLQESLENKLDESNQWLHEYEDAIIGYNTLVKTTPQLLIKEVNENYLRLTKYTKEEMLGRPITDFIAQESLLNLGHMIHTIQSAETYQSVIKGKPKEGEPFYIDSFIKPIKNKEGELVEFFIIGTDVTKLINFHEEIEASQKEIVYKMGEIGESRSKETGNHVKRVAEYSKLLALLYGLSEEEAEILFSASPMHDIGKVAISDSVLNKPGKLTEDEYELMKAHATIGYEVLKGSQRNILQSAAIIAHEHHEKWDGSGYPRGLKSEDIHIYGRITALADVLDALGNERCYKPAWEFERILALFKEERGKHFDPKLVDLFFDNLDKFLFIRDKFRDEIQ